MLARSNLLLHKVRQTPTQRSWMCTHLKSPSTSASPPDEGGTTGELASCEDVLLREFIGSSAVFFSVAFVPFEIRHWAEQTLLTCTYGRGTKSGYTRLRSALLAQLVEHLHGKEGVNGSSPLEGFTKPCR